MGAGASVGIEHFNGLRSNFQRGSFIVSNHLSPAVGARSVLESIVPTQAGVIPPEVVLYQNGSSYVMSLIQTLQDRYNDPVMYDLKQLYTREELIDLLGRGMQSCYSGSIAAALKYLLDYNNLLRTITARYFSSSIFNGELNTICNNNDLLLKDTICGLFELLCPIIYLPGDFVFPRPRDIISEINTCFDQLRALVASKKASSSSQSSGLYGALSSQRSSWRKRGPPEGSSGGTAKEAKSGFGRRRRRRSKRRSRRSKSRSRRTSRRRTRRLRRRTRRARRSR
jgi:hypothetical protein